MVRSVKDRLVASYQTFLWILLYFGVVIYIVLSALLYNTSLWILPLLYALWYLYDFGVEDRGGRKFLWYKTKWNTACYKHFPVKLVKTGELSPEKNSILGCHPHGQFLIGPMGAFACNAADLEILFPGTVARLFFHSALFYIPFMRELLLAAGVLGVSKKSLEHILSGSRGVACAFSIGGAREAVEECSSRIVLILKSRKGFVKLAIRHGADLVPTFTFGENLTYRQMDLPKDSTLKVMQQWLLSKSLNAIPVAYGRSALFGKYGLAPFRVPLTLVVGEPIQVEQNDSPTQEEIDRIHEQYVDALKALYETYNPIYGVPDTPLVIK